MKFLLKQAGLSIIEQELPAAELERVLQRLKRGRMPRGRETRPRHIHQTSILVHTDILAERRRETNP
jgi:hypothetical protein